MPLCVTQSALGAAPGRAPAGFASGFDEIHTTLLKVTPPWPGPLCVPASAFPLPQRHGAAIPGLCHSSVGLKTSPILAIAGQGSSP